MPRVSDCQLGLDPAKGFDQNALMPDIAGTQVWAGFSVRDHCLPRAYVAELLLYDRLVIPTPPPAVPGDPETRWDPKAVEYWNRSNWNPGKLREVLRRLCRPGYDRVTTIAWDKPLRERWKAKMADTEEALRSASAAFDLTGDVLMQSLSGVQFRAVTGYPSDAARFTRDGEKDGTLLPSMEAGEPSSARQQDLALRIGARFCVPEDSQRPDEYMLDQALELSSSPEFGAARRDFYLWLNGLPVDKLSDGTVLSQAEAALREWNALVRGAGHTTRSKFVFVTVRLMPAAADVVGAVFGIPPVIFAGTNCALEMASCASDLRAEQLRPYGPTPATLIDMAREGLVPVGPIRALTSRMRYRWWQLAENA
jgi:hypothetical protein